MIKIHKEVYGQGQPIVLIHGWAMHTGVWRQFAQKLANHYQVTCLDLPGHGLSETVEPYTLSKISETLIASIPDTSFCVLGWSLGASVAMTLASQYPERINSLILLAGNPKFVQSDGWSGIQANILTHFSKNLSQNSQLTLSRFLTLLINHSPKRNTISKQIETALQEHPSPSQKVLQAGLAILFSADLRNNLASLNCPVSIIQGDKDSLVPLKTSKNLEQLLPTCDINIISGAEHVPFLSHQAEVLTAINNFLSQT